MTMIRAYPANEAQIGDIIVYHMRIEEHPVDPTRLWHGTILMVLINTADRSQQRFYMVRSHEYPDCTELIYPPQVVNFSPQTYLLRE